MSYILNALRKAEKEHQDESNASWLNDGQHEQSSGNKHTVLWVIAVLILINLITLSFIFISNKKNETSKTEPVVEANISKNKAEQSKQKFSPLNLRSEGDQEKPDIKSQPGTEKSIGKSFSEIVGAEHGAKVTRKESSSKDKFSAVEVINPDKSVNAEYKPEEVKKVKAELLPPKQSIPEQVEIIAETNTDESMGSDDTDIPTFKELPRDFRRTVPEMNINVYGYSEDDSERFVIIDMVKYTSGSKLPENMQLKDIRNDSLVVEFRGKTFRVMRP